MRTEPQRVRHRDYMRQWRARKVRAAWGEWDLGDPTWWEVLLVAGSVVVTVGFLLVTRNG